MNYVFKGEDVKAMIEHWLRLPPNGYVGVDGGRNLHEILMKPMTDDNADIVLQWMKADMPILRTLSDSDLSIVSEPVGHDRQAYSILLGDILIPLQPQPENTSGGQYYANAQ